MADVMIRLDEEKARHLREILNGDVPMPKVHCRLCQELRAALDSPPVEERVEGRVVGIVGMGPRVGQRFEGRANSRLDVVRRVAREEARRGNRDVCIQSRTITTFSDGSTLISPWSDLPGEGESDDG